MAKGEGPIPSVDEILRSDVGRLAGERFGHAATVGAVRAALDSYRGVSRSSGARQDRAEIALAVALAATERLNAADVPRLRRVFNLTGTVLHTNLGRAVLAEEAVAAATLAMREAVALEYDLETGGRGERDDAVRGLLKELTGAEDALVVNNNAAAVLLVLNTLALRRGAIVSRGELIEIGGSFRMPEIMARAGAELVEVGTTNRTHLKDYEAAVGASTGLLLKVHTSNYLIQGFTKEVATHDLAQLAAKHSIPLVDDLGSGTLADLSVFGLKRERTVQDAVKDGADLVTFSGDKLLGGPQAGFVVGRKDLVAACAGNPLKRALRLDKIRLAALEATLKLYRDPDRLAARLPTLRYLSRSKDAIGDAASRVATALVRQLGNRVTVEEIDCASQIGSGALPLETVPSRGVRLTPAAAGKPSGRRVERIATAFRALPLPVIGRIEKNGFVLDLRCLDDEQALIDELPALRWPDAAEAT